MPEGLPSLARMLASTEVRCSCQSCCRTKAQGKPRKWRTRDGLNERGECTLTCFKLAFHELRLGSLPTVKEPALAFTPKNQSRGTPGWGRVCCACPQKRHIHRHLLPCNGKPPRDYRTSLLKITKNRLLRDLLLFRAVELFCTCSRDRHIKHWSKPREYTTQRVNES